MPQNPFLFIVGCARSGTTLLQRMLDHHPLLAVINEARFVLPMAKQTCEIDLPLTSEVIGLVRSNPRFPKVGLSDATISTASAQARTYSEFVSSLYSEYGKVHGKALVGEKTPRYVLLLPRVHAMFPWVKTIHLIRDGRDVALSVLNWANQDKGPGRYGLWRREPIAVCAMWWRKHVEAGQCDGHNLGPEHYREVKYEHLVDRTEDALREITDFLGLPFAAEMLAYHEGKTITKSTLSPKKAWLPPTPGLRNWRTQMPAREVELFEALAGDRLTTLGYDRAFKTISPEVTTVAQECRDWWEREMTRRREKKVRRYIKMNTQSSGAPYGNSQSP